MEHPKMKILGFRENIQELEPKWKLGNTSYEKYTDHLIESSNIPKRFLTAFLSEIPDEIYLEMLDFPNKKGFYLWGPVGTGKTFIVCSLINHQIQNYKVEGWETPENTYYENRTTIPRFCSMPEILLEIRASFSGKGTDESKIIEKYSSRQCLIIDDIGVEKLSEFANQTIYLIINNRYENKLQTIFTSNMNLNQLAEKLGDRISSRIAEMCKVINLTGKDRRISK